MSQHTGHEIQRGAAQSADVPSEVEGGLVGELATAPWMGLHYLTEGP
jgi:hypothetical protein